jgi:hypothetical protein
VPRLKITNNVEKLGSLDLLAALLASLGDLRALRSSAKALFSGCVVLNDLVGRGVAFLFS